MKEIPLSKGKFALVDDEDYEFLMQWKWHVSSRGYVAHSENYRREDGERRNRQILMHTLIFKTDECTDHINGDRLDNRKINLRAATIKDNARNRKPQKHRKTKGAYYHKDAEKWSSSIMVDGKKIYLGRFLTEADAAEAYDVAARLHFKEFAKTNF